MKRVVFLLFALLPLVATGATEDFTTFTESDSGGYWTITDANTITGTNVKGGETGIYKDYTADHFTGDFTHYIEVNPEDSKGANVNGTQISVWMLSNTVDSFADLDAANADCLFLKYLMDDGTNHLFTLEDGADDSNDPSIAVSDTTPYYIVITRVSNTLTAKIYTDSGHTSLVDTMTTTCTGATNYRYFAACSTKDAGADKNLSIILENYDLNEAAAPTATPTPANTATPTPTATFTPVPYTHAIGRGVAVGIGQGIR